MLIFAWNVPLVSVVFLKRSLVFPILLFSSISLHWLLREGFLIPPCYSLELCIQMGSYSGIFWQFCLCLSEKSIFYLHRFNIYFDRLMDLGGFFSFNLWLCFSIVFCLTEFFMRSLLLFLSLSSSMYFFKKLAAFKILFFAVFLATELSYALVWSSLYLAYMKFIKKLWYLAYYFNRICKKTLYLSFQFSFCFATSFPTFMSSWGFNYMTIKPPNIIPQVTDALLAVFSFYNFFVLYLFVLFFISMLL